jgi:hypothetical protein
MSKPAVVILLCEDTLTSTLLRSYLKRLRFDPRNIRFIVSPRGRGSGEHFVLKQYPEQVNAYRLSKAKKETWLIVAVDADTGTVARRLEQLSASLRQCENLRLREMRIEDERIARLVPRRNVETWILVLTGTTTNEQDDYGNTRHRDDWNDMTISASLELYNWTRPNAQIPDYCVNSLRDGIRELMHLSNTAR